LELLSTSVTSDELRKKRLLIYGSCLKKEAPKLLAKLSKGKTLLHVCLEEVHMNVVGFKLATILKVSEPKSVTVLTFDGSPHCLQLHFAVEQAKDVVEFPVEVTHYVIEKGQLRRISPPAVKVARHLSRIQSLMDKGRA
jgi:hypothetical protein